MDESVIWFVSLPWIKILKSTTPDVSGKAADVEKMFENLIYILGFIRIFFAEIEAVIEIWFSG